MERCGNLERSRPYLPPNYLFAFDVIVYNPSLYSRRPDTSCLYIVCRFQVYYRNKYLFNLSMGRLVARMNATETESYGIRNAFRLAGEGAPQRSE
jgi:hypothetical protein